MTQLNKVEKQNLQHAVSKKIGKSLKVIKYKSYKVFKEKNNYYYANVTISIDPYISDTKIKNVSFKKDISIKKGLESSEKRILIRPKYDSKDTISHIWDHDLRGKYHKR